MDPGRLRAYGIALRDVVSAVRQANHETGGGVIELAEHEQVVRGRGYVRSLEDLEQVPLRVGEAGVPVLLRDVARVAFGPDLRRGLVELDGEGEVVGGIVVMRFGENALAVIDAVKARLAEVRLGLPEGVELVTTYDRSELIHAAVGTLSRTLLEELAVVSVVIAVFLLHVRSALIPILVIPIGVSLAFVPMLYQGLTLPFLYSHFAHDYPPPPEVLAVWVEHWGEGVMLPFFNIPEESYRGFQAAIMLPFALALWMLMGGTARLLANLFGGKQTYETYLKMNDPAASGRGICLLEQFELLNM